MSETTQTRANEEENAAHPVYSDLHEIAEQNHISTEGEKAISKVVAGHPWHWHQIPQDKAVEVLTEIQMSGIEAVQHRALAGSGSNGEEQPVADEVEAEGEVEKPTSLTVYDEDEGGMVTVAAETRNMANSLQQRMDVATLMTAIVMKRMVDEKLYLGVDKGYSSFREYAEVRCPFNYRQAYKYAAIGRKFAPMLSNSFSDGVQSTAQIEAGEQSLNGNIDKLGELGIEKLYELSKIEDTDFTELPSEGKVILKDGSELDLEEIKSQSARAFKGKMDEYRQYIEDQEAELNTTATERDDALAEKQQIEKEAEVGRRYKDMYGKKSTDFEAYKSRLMTARSRAADLNQALSKIKDMPADFEALTGELQDLHGMIDRGLTHLREDNLESGAFAVRSNVEG